MVWGTFNESLAGKAPLEIVTAGRCGGGSGLLNFVQRSVYEGRRRLLVTGDGREPPGCDEGQRHVGRLSGRGPRRATEPCRHRQDLGEESPASDKGFSRERPGVAAARGMEREVHLARWKELAVGRASAGRATKAIRPECCCRTRRGPVVPSSGVAARHHRGSQTSWSGGR